MKISITILSLLLLSSSYLIGQIKVIEVISDDTYESSFGLINQQSGDTLIHPKYDNVTPYFNKIGLAIVEKNDLYGVVNMEGKEIVSLEFDRIYFHKEYITIVKGDKFGLCNAKGEILIKPKYNYLGSVESGLIRANIGGDARLPSNGIYSENSEVTGGKWGFVDLSGKKKIPFTYTYAYDFKNGIAKIYKGGKNIDGLYDGSWNFIDENNKLIISEQISGQDDFTNGLMIVSKEETKTIIDEYDYEETETITRYGIINTKGEYLIKPDYYSISFVNNLLIQTKKTNEDSYQLLRFDLSPVIDKEIQAIKSHGLLNSDSLLFIKTNNLWGIINTSGNVIVPPSYYEIEPDMVRNKIVIYVKKNTSENGILTGIINLKGKEILPVAYEDIMGSSSIYPDYSFIVKKNKKWGKIDDKLQQIIPFEYDTLLPTEIKHNNNIVFLASKNKKWGLVDNLNNEIIEIIFDSLPNNYNIRYGFYDNMIEAKIEGKAVLISAEGKFRYLPKYEYIDYGSNTWKLNQIEVSENGKVGLTDTLANVKVPIIYNELISTTPFIIAHRDSAYYLIDSENGSELMKFDDINWSQLFISIDNELMCPVKKDTKWGYINTARGVIHINFLFDEIMRDNFYCGVNRVKINNKYGLIDKTGTLVIPVEYDEMITRACCTDYEKNVSMKIEVKKGKYWGVLNKDGSIIKEVKYKDRQH